MGNTHIFVDVITTIPKPITPDKVEGIKNKESMTIAERQRCGSIIAHFNKRIMENKQRKEHIMDTDDPLPPRVLMCLDHEYKDVNYSVEEDVDFGGWHVKIFPGV